MSLSKDEKDRLDKLNQSTDRSPSEEEELGQLMNRDNEEVEPDNSTPKKKDNSPAGETPAGATPGTRVSKTQDEPNASQQARSPLVQDQKPL